MPKNEDGEFELVLGNKQLLSMFFVVVVLLGVFFVMGYIVGRNSAPLLSAEIAKKPDEKPLVVESPAKQTPIPAENPPAETSEKPAEKAPAAVQPAPAEKIPAPAPAPAVKAEAPKAEPASKAKADTKARPAATNGPPTAGATYLQLSATDKSDADKMVEELRKNGFQAIDAEVPEKPGLFRVLVGPMTGPEVNKTRADLQSKSFPGDKAIPRKF